MRSEKKINLAQPIIGRAEKRAVLKVLKSGNLAQGIEVTKLENEFSSFVGDRECIAVNSGTSALITALISVGVTPGDEVIVPSFTFAATANSVALVGAIPVFVDINPHTFNLDIKEVERAITPKTKAIQVVHLYGLPADMPAIMDIAAKHNLLVIEDAAQAHLASINGKPVGTFGDAAAFSFYPTKNMTTGEGGMVVVKDSAMARRARLLRNQGMEIRYQNEIPGFNFRMTDIHAAIGVQQIKKLESWTEKRIENANFYNQYLSEVTTPITPIGFRHVFHQYTILVPRRRDELSDFLTKVRIGNAIYYPTQVHRLPSFASRLELPLTEEATKQVLSIPIHPKLRKQDLKKVCDVINSFMSKS